MKDQPTALPTRLDRNHILPSRMWIKLINHPVDPVLVDERYAQFEPRRFDLRFFVSTTDASNPPVRRKGG